MRFRVGRCLLVVATGVLVVLVRVALPGSAGAADRVIARDTHIGQVLALDGMVVYSRYVNDKPPLKRPWMRIVNGRVLPARGLRAPILRASIGLDANGRVVVSFARDRWWIYDVATDRARAVRGLPVAPDYYCSELSIWRSRLAFDLCDRAYLRIGTRTQRVPPPSGLEWVVGQGSGAPRLRGAALFGQVDDGSDGTYVSLLADASGFCRNAVPWLGFGDAYPYFVGGWWLSRHYLTWQGSLRGPTGVPLYGARLSAHCRLPGPTGLLFTPPHNGVVMTVDDRFVYYGNSTIIRRHRLPPKAFSPTPPPAP